MELIASAPLGGLGQVIWTAMYLALRLMMGWLFDMIFAWFDWFLVGLALWVEELTEWLWGLLPEEALDILNGVDLATIANAVDIVSYFIPIGGFMLIWLATLTAVALIRLVRWVLAVIPTIGG